MAGLGVEAGEQVLLLGGGELEAALEMCPTPEHGLSNRRSKLTIAAGILIGSAVLASVAMARGNLRGSVSKMAISPAGLREAVSLQEVRNDDDCLCLFDVDRTLTVAQGFAESCGPDTKEYAGVHDPAFRGGDLVLSPVALHLNKTFCSKCHKGIITAGHGGGWDERSVLFHHIGEFRWSPAHHVNSPLVYGCHDGHKHHCAKRIVDWMAKQGTFVKPERVHFFDDHFGNTRHFEHEYGYNARLISCDTRDQGGLIGLCGAQLSEIVPDKGTSQCGV